MRAIDLLQETAAAFNSNRARSLLTILGVVIGIAAVISMTALIGGMKQALVGEMGLSQARIVGITCSYGQGMTLSDVKDLASELGEYYESVEPMSYAVADVASQTKKASGSVRGAGPYMVGMMGQKMAQGRFFSQREYDAGALVAVLDQAGVKQLFGSEDAAAVGQTVRVKGAEYEVVGVLASEGALVSSSSVSVYLPFTTCAQRIVGGMNVDEADGLVHEDVDPEAAAEATRAWLAKRYRIPEDMQGDAIYVITMKSIIEQLDSLVASFQLLMTAVASISLVVGGIGIMNMMLTNVTERIREIGLRKALGARRRDITLQFLLESVCLTLAGGVLGILLGYLGAFGLAGIASGALGASGMTLTPSIGLDSVLMVAGICILIGVVFGSYPARRAAKLDPVESLHYQ